MLEVRDIDCFFGTVQVLRGISLEVGAGEVLCLLGRNGAGKSTTLKTIMGLIKPRAGSISMQGVELTKLPAHQVPRQAIGYVPQGRRLFSEMTVAENLEIGLLARDPAAEEREEDTRERVLQMFPILRERLGQQAGTLSGGEQQMLAMGRALCVVPKVLLLDEPTEGLMPAMINQIRETVLTLKSDGVAIILVEQRVDAVLPVADRVAFIENGRNQATVTIAELQQDDSLLAKYVGIGH